MATYRMEALACAPLAYRRWWEARVAEVRAHPEKATCGRCAAFKDGYCGHPDRYLDIDDDALERTTPRHPACAFFTKELC